MSEPGAYEPGLTCSFCGKQQKDVRYFISGPSVYICDECLEACNEIAKEKERTADSNIPMAEPESAQSKLERAATALRAAGIPLVPGFVTPGGTTICIFGETRLAIMSGPLIDSDYDQVMKALAGFKVLAVVKGGPA